MPNFNIEVIFWFLENIKSVNELNLVFNSFINTGTVLSTGRNRIWGSWHWWWAILFPPGGCHAKSWKQRGNAFVNFLFSLTEDRGGGKYFYERVTIEKNVLSINFWRWWFKLFVTTWQFLLNPIKNFWDLTFIISFKKVSE